MAVDILLVLLGCCLVARANAVSFRQARGRLIGPKQPAVHMTIAHRVLLVAGTMVAIFGGAQLETAERWHAWAYVGTFLPLMAASIGTAIVHNYRVRRSHQDVVAAPKRA